jgi:hypothetical protein
VNKIKQAARERMARTGEPYTLARRMVIEEHKRSLAAIEAGTGLVSLDPPPPVPADGVVRDADTGVFVPDWRDA